MTPIILDSYVLYRSPIYKMYAELGLLTHLAPHTIILLFYSSTIVLDNSFGSIYKSCSVFIYPAQYLYILLSIYISCAAFISCSIYIYILHSIYYILRAVFIYLVQYLHILRSIYNILCSIYISGAVFTYPYNALSKFFESKQVKLIMSKHTSMLNNFILHVHKKQQQKKTMTGVHPWLQQVPKTETALPRWTVLSIYFVLRQMAPHNSSPVPRPELTNLHACACRKTARAGYIPNQ